MKITVAIPTYNRPDYIKKCAASLYQVDGINDCNIRIYDDCSTEINDQFLREQFPEASDIVVREINLKADRNMAQMYRDFLDTGDELFFGADSDTIFRPDILHTIDKLVGKTDGVLSLYNSSLHESISMINIADEPCLLKRHIGAAGTVFTRKVIAEIVENVDMGRLYDWRWSEYLRQKGRRLIVTNASYVQHIGLDGENNSLELYDFGVNFEPVTDVNKDILLDMLTNVFDRMIYQREATAEALRSTEFKIGYCFTHPLSAMKLMLAKVTNRK
jgi:Glycosyl transferase family 2